jgi:signal transduction histidine kinase
MKSEVLAIVTHDLRSPLSSILLGAQVLVTQGGRVKSRERKAILEQIVTCANQQIKFVNDLLALARGDATEARRQLSDVKLSEVAWDVIRSISFDAGAKKLSIEVFAPVGDLSIFGDRSRISQIFGNLLTNAVKFTPEGGDITVVIEQEPSGACVKVSDTGVGIPAEQLPHLFETFKAPQTVGTAGETGTGLGLSIVCQALQQHGGAIEVDSEPGAGTTFTLHLPFRCAPAARHRISHHRSARRGAKARSSPSGRPSVRTESLQG